MPRRYALSNKQWIQIKDFLPGRRETVGVTARDNRKFVDAVLWILRSGAPWRSLPEHHGDWKHTHKRFSRWAGTGVWERVFNVLTKDPDNRHIAIDGAIVRARQHAAGARGKGKKKTRLWGVPEEGRARISILSATAAPSGRGSREARSTT